MPGKGSLIRIPVMFLLCPSTPDLARSRDPDLCLLVSTAKRFFDKYEREVSALLLMIILGEEEFLFIFV